MNNSLKIILLFLSFFIINLNYNIAESSETDPIEIIINVIDRAPYTSSTFDIDDYIQDAISEANEELFNGIGMEMTSSTVTDNSEYIFELDCSETEELNDLVKEHGNKWQDDEANVLVVGTFVNCGSPTPNGMFIPFKYPGENKGRKLIIIGSGMSTENAAQTLAHEFGHLARMNHTSSSDNFLYTNSSYNDWSISTGIAESTQGNILYFYDQATSQDPRNQVETLQDVWNENDEWDNWD